MNIKSNENSCFSAMHNRSNGRSLRVDHVFSWRNGAVRYSLLAASVTLIILFTPTFILAQGTFEFVGLDNEGLSESGQITVSGGSVLSGNFNIGDSVYGYSFNLSGTSWAEIGGNSGDVFAGSLPSVNRPGFLLNLYDSGFGSVGAGQGWAVSSVSPGLNISGYGTWELTSVPEPSITVPFSLGLPVLYIYHRQSRHTR